MCTTTYIHWCVHMGVCVCANILKTGQTTHNQTQGQKQKPTATFRNLLYIYIKKKQKQQDLAIDLFV